LGDESPAAGGTSAAALGFAVGRLHRAAAHLRLAALEVFPQLPGQPRLTLCLPRLLSCSPFGRNPFIHATHHKSAAGDLPSLLDTAAMIGYSQAAGSKRPHMLP